MSATAWGNPRPIRTNGVTLTVHTFGAEDGPMVLLLHGFPECAHGWRRQIPALVAAGWFCVVPDQRGYATSEKPARVRDYTVDQMVGDALGLADHFGRARFHLVSHDWGGVVGWHTALDHPDRVATFTAMNIPHPGVFERHLRTLGQLRRSWYIFAFQLPWVAEWLLSHHDRLVRMMFANTVTKPFTDEDLAAYRAAWAVPGALTGMVNWYRAARTFTRPAHDRVTRPTLIVFGQQDLALDWAMVPLSADRCDDVTVELIADAGHFVQHDAADRVNGLLLAFLDRHRGETGTAAAGRIS